MKPWQVAAAAALALALIMGVGVIVLVGIVQDAAPKPTPGCTSQGSAVPVGDVTGSKIPHLDQKQSNNARTIVATGQQLHVPQRGFIVAIATAYQEAVLRNLASRANPGSLAYPHDAVAAGDHDSVGIFQQRDAWGPMGERMNVAKSARLFYTGGHAGQRGLLSIPGWQHMSIAAAAQAVQVSAFPTAYARWEALATQTVATITGGAPPPDLPVLEPAASTDCAPADPATVGGGAVVYPAPKATDRHNYGGHGGHWSSYHTGTDFSNPCGTPANAAHAGTVHIENGPSWYGRWLVKVSTGPHSLTTWYAHMQKVIVHDGQTVQPGQELGEIGALGNATGCHLHFEVHPKNGRIYEDGVNPSVWLAKHVGHNLGGGTPGGTVPASTVGHGAFTIASFNVLGDSHTGGRGKDPGWRNGAHRTPGMVAIIQRHGIDVAGLQEFQKAQWNAFHRLAGGSFGMYRPPHARTDNTIIWRLDRFEAVTRTWVRIPYFGGQMLRMPVVRLRYKPTGATFWLGNFHNPAETGQWHHQGGYRARATRTEVNLTRRLRAGGSPVFITGDMNARAAFFCPMVRSGMHAAAGGTVSPCRPPKHNGQGIDWILASPDASFIGFGVDWSGIAHRVTDHPVPYAEVR